MTLSLETTETCQNSQVKIFANLEDWIKLARWTRQEMEGRVGWDHEGGWNKKISCLPISRVQVLMNYS